MEYETDETQKKRTVTKPHARKMVHFGRKRKQEKFSVKIGAEQLK